MQSCLGRGAGLPLENVLETGPVVLAWFIYPGSGSDSGAQKCLFRGAVWGGSKSVL